MTPVFSTPEDHDIRRKYVTHATWHHEGQAQANLKARTLPGGWVRLAKNRIAFRHDERRGPESATLTHAVY